MASLQPRLAASAIAADNNVDSNVHSPLLGRHSPATSEGKMGNSRRRLGLLLLALVIFFWTATNFLASAILADHSFSHPFFVTYVNTLFFIIPLPPALLYKAYREPEEFRQWVEECKGGWRRICARGGWRSNGGEGDDAHFKRRRESSEGLQESLLAGDHVADVSPHSPASARSYDSRPDVPHQLSLAATAKLSLEFCLLWFIAGYFLLVCLEYTTVASSTILTSTASAFTLVFGALLGVERFTVRKLLSVLLSLVGIVLISSVDFSGKSSDDDHRGQFPEKTMHELALGNTLALLSAMVYAIYIVRMKKRFPDERAISMPIFFGFVGLANALLLWPGFFILHWIGLEPFEFPAPGRVTTILLTNAAGSMLSDVLWAYAVLLTSPILVTVGLSMTIPLTLVGQIILMAQTSTFVYWIGAAVVVMSFVIVSHDDQKEEMIGDEPVLGR